MATFFNAPNSFFCTRPSLALNIFGCHTTHCCQPLKVVFWRRASPEDPKSYTEGSFITARGSYVGSGVKGLGLGGWWLRACTGSLYGSGHPIKKNYYWEITMNGVANERFSKEVIMNIYKSLHDTALNASSAFCFLLFFQLLGLKQRPASDLATERKGDHNSAPLSVFYFKCLCCLYYHLMHSHLSFLHSYFPIFLSRSCLVFSGHMSNVYIPPLVFDVRIPTAQTLSEM